MEKSKQTEEMVEIPHDYLIEGVKKAVDDVFEYMKDARRKYGSSYNEKNDYEMFSRRFGYEDAERIWKEFTLVANKRSNRPASVRGVITVLGNKARYYAIERMRKEYQEKKQAN